MDTVAAFILGLVGSLHCAGMCGPLALALPPAGNTRAAYVLGRLAYNFGRVVTYAALGLVFGLVGRSFLLAGVQQWISILLGIALLSGLLISHRLGRWLPVTRLVEGLKARMARLLRKRSLGSLALLGLLNGLLPCGLVYVACAGAAATGSVVGGVQYMTLFGLGTAPMMLAIGLSGALVPLQARVRLRKLIPVAVGLLGVLLILRGMALGIPYISPDLSAAGEACCH